MAELVSIRSSDGKGEKRENKIATQESVTNPAYSDDFETAQSTQRQTGRPKVVRLKHPRFKAQQYRFTMSSTRSTLKLNEKKSRKKS